jgi:hypothetical protein
MQSESNTHAKSAHDNSASANVALMDHRQLQMLAHMDFSPVPAELRANPARVKSVPARLRVDNYWEHRQAYEFVQRQQDLHGEGSRTIVRALLHYRDDIVFPLEELREKQLTSGRRINIPDKYLIAQLAFRPVPASDRHTPARIKNMSARLYIDKYIEHRLAYEFIASQQENHGEGLKTLVRALIHYRDTVIRPLQLDQPAGSQLGLDLDGGT